MIKNVKVIGIVLILSSVVIAVVAVFCWIIVAFVFISIKTEYGG